MTEDQNHSDRPDTLSDDDLSSAPGTSRSVANEDDTIHQVTRSVELEASPAAVWEAVADPDQRGAWLDDDDAMDRTMRVDGIDPGRSLTWTWWRPDDESGASQVRIALTELDDGSTRVAVTERLLGPQTVASRPSQARMQASATSPLWDYRLLGLELLVVATGALVG
jgi:uncharacterized protein YndB with AHSA1/START domain